MAKPIKETPHLTGKDAERFRANIFKNETDPTTRVSREERERVKESYRKLKLISTFPEY